MDVPQRVRPGSAPGRPKVRPCYSFTEPSGERRWSLPYAPWWRDSVIAAVGIEDNESQDRRPPLHRALVTPLTQTETFHILGQTPLGSFRDEGAVR